jgi:DNA-directed RNA polymerase subunit H (RpoH/RPB5)
MAPEEGARMLREGRLARGDLPAIYANDPPLVWAGARAGQIVEITSDSLTAGEAVSHRRVVEPVYDPPSKGRKAAAPKS